MVESLEDRIASTLRTWSGPLDAGGDPPLTLHERLLSEREQRERIIDLAKAVFATAVQDALLADSPEALAAMSPATRDEILAYKASAWYWFFGFPYAGQPRWTLEQVCQLIDRDPDVERTRIRRLAGEPQSTRIPPAILKQLAEVGPRDQPLGSLKPGAGRRRVAA